MEKGCKRIREGSNLHLVSVQICRDGIRFHILQSTEGDCCRGHACRDLARAASSMRTGLLRMRSIVVAVGIAASGLQKRRENEERFR